MTEYNDVVEQQRIRLNAQEWAKCMTDMHVHSLNSMWYDDRPQDTENNKMVTDIRYNSGIIKRWQDGVLIHTFGKRLSNQEIVEAYLKGSA